MTPKDCLFDRLKRACRDPIILSTKGVIAMATLNLSGLRNCCAIARPATRARKGPHCPAVKGVMPANWQLDTSRIQICCACQRTGPCRTRTHAPMGTPSGRPTGLFPDHILPTHDQTAEYTSWAKRMHTCCGHMGPPTKDEARSVCHVAHKSVHASDCRQKRPFCSAHSQRERLPTVHILTVACMHATEHRNPPVATPTKRHITSTVRGHSKHALSVAQELWPDVCSALAAVQH